MWFILLAILLTIKVVSELIVAYYKIKTRRLEERWAREEQEFRERQRLIEEANMPDSEYMQSYWPQLDEILDDNDIEFSDDE